MTPRRPVSRGLTPVLLGAALTASSAGAQEQPEAMDVIMRKQPNKRLGRPEEVAAAVVRPGRDAASFVLGVALPVDGGYIAT